MLRTTKMLFGCMMVAGLGLTGCQHDETIHRERPEIQVFTSLKEQEIGFAYQKSALTTEARAQLDDFVMKHQISGRDEVLIELRADPASLDQKRAEVVAAYLQHLGLRPEIRQLRRNGSNNLQSVNVKLVDYIAHVPDCPNWTDPQGTDYSNRISSNFGCSTASILAQMVANPKDLVAPGTLSSGDGEYLANTIGAYQKSEGSFLESRMPKESE